MPDMLERRNEISVGFALINFSHRMHNGDHLHAEPFVFASLAILFIQDGTP